MDKIIVLYDKNTNQIRSENGTYIGAPLDTVVYFKQQTSVDEIAKLVSSGMGADDIIKLKNSGVI